MSGNNIKVSCLNGDHDAVMPLTQHLFRLYAGKLIPCFSNRKTSGD